VTKATAQVEKAFPAAPSSASALAAALKGTLTSKVVEETKTLAALRLYD
jgi:hypothetical protein